MPGYQKPLAKDGGKGSGSLASVLLTAVSAFWGFSRFLANNIRKITAVQNNLLFDFGLNIYS